MATVNQTPAALSLAGNLKPFKISSTESVQFRLLKGGVELLSQRYEPGADGVLEIDVKAVVFASLDYTMNSANSYVQSAIAADFVGEVDGASFAFRAVRGGVANLADTDSNWLRNHFLTWQPKVKPVTYYSPEWLTYYGVQEATIKLLATFDGGATQTLTLASVAAGTAVTVNVQYASIAGRLGNVYPTHYKVWAESTAGARLTDEQFYSYSEPLSDDEQWYLFENSVGGLDTFRAYGVNNFEGEHTHNIAEFGDTYKEYEVDTERIYNKNTGYLDEYARAWLLDFFPSRAKFVYADNTIRKIVVTDSDVKYASSDLPSAYTFSYKFADKTQYLNLIRNESELPTNLVVPNIDAPDFIFPTRLSELPRILLTEGVLIPAFDANSPTATVTTFGEVKQVIVEAVMASLPTTGETPGSGTLVVLLPSTDDVTEATDLNVFTARRAMGEISDALAKNAENTDKRYLRKDVADSAEEDITFKKNIDVKGLAKTLNLSVEELSTLAKAIVTEIGSSSFVPGFDGEGFKIWQTLAGKWNGELDTLTIRETMTVFELLIEKIRALKGALVVSQGNGKAKSITTRGTDYVIEIEDDISFVPDDFVRFQMFSGKQMRFYWVKVKAVEDNSIVVPVSEFNGVIPSIGDDLVQMGNETNALRQALLYISASEDGKPRFDILDGVNQKNFTDSLRVRLGALDGINDPDFPLDNQPRGHGLYGDNVFLKGTFVLSTGEDILTRFSVVEGLVQSSVEGLRKDFTEDKSYLDNASFGDGLSKWKTENEATLFRFGAKWLWINNAPLSNKSDFAAIKQDDGRTTVFIKNNYIKQKNSDLRFIPTYLDTNIDGQKLASAVYLLFFYRVKTAGRLRVEFEGLNQAGFEPFNAFSYDGDLEVCDGYKTFDCSGLWNGTGDFKLSFTGEINLYMLILSTDRAEALAYRYKTFFEQSEKLIKIAATNFDKYGNVLESSHIITTAKYNELISQRFNADGTLKNVSGLVTSADFTNLFTRAMSENGVVVEADIRLFITADDAGNLISNATIKADQIELEGLVTANKNFKILEDGSIEAKNADIKGKITASDGNIGYFSINNEGLYYGDPSKWSDISYKQDLAALTPGLIRLQSEESNFVPGDIANIKVAIGNGSDPSITGSGKSCYSAGYFYRQMNASSGDWYTPAVKIISDNVVNRDVALYTDGAIVCQGGLLSSGHFNDANSVTVLDFSFGSTVLIYNTAYRYVYLPTLSNMKQLLNSTGVFAVFVRLVARYENNENFKVAFQNGQTSLYFRNNNGAHYGNDIDMGAGDILELLLIYDGGNYYAQVVDRKT